MTFFRDDDTWKAYIEPKCKIFSWLVIHDMVLIVDNMSRKTGLLILVALSATAFRKQLLTCSPNVTILKQLRIVSTHFNLPNYNTLHAQGGPQQWLQFIWRTCYANEKRIKLGIVLTFWWQI
jgi:hypothetical protein